MYDPCTRHKAQREENETPRGHCGRESPQRKKRIAQHHVRNRPRARETIKIDYFNRLSTKSSPASTTLPMSDISTLPRPHTPTFGSNTARKVHQYAQILPQAMFSRPCLNEIDDLKKDMIIPRSREPSLEFVGEVEKLSAEEVQRLARQRLRSQMRNLGGISPAELRRLAHEELKKTKVSLTALIGLLLAHTIIAGRELPFDDHQTGTWRCASFRTALQVHPDGQWQGGDRLERRLSGPCRMGC